MFRQLMDVQYFLSVVYHNLGLENERDEAARRHYSTENERKRLSIRASDREVVAIWQVVAEVGAALSSRY